MKFRTALGFALSIALAGTSVAQDSVSPAPGLPGDAVSPYSVAEQSNAYVVDLAPLETSWGTVFGIAPLAKASKTDPLFFSSLTSAQAVSVNQLEEAAFVRNSYAYWRGQGPGVNGGVNTAPATISTNGFRGAQFSAAFAEFGGNSNLVTSAIINYLPTAPSRLYVTRTTAAVNGASAAENRSQIGFGTVDAAGNVYFRADDFGTSGPNPIVGNNWFRIDTPGRNAASLNIIDNAGASDAAASDWLLVRDADVHNPPCNIPGELAGRPVLLGSNFATEFVFETAPSVLATTTAHRAGSSDHRGNIAYSPIEAFPGLGTVGTAAMQGKDAAVGGLTRRVLLWGVDANGAVNGNFSFDPPLTITDNATSFSFPNGGTIDEFIMHVSQTGFRGGNGPIALGQDAAGRVLVAYHVVSSALAPSGSNPINAIAVARFDPADPAATIEHTIAAYNDFPGGKPLPDGPGGNPIGQIVELNQVTGGAPFGPSLSAPSIDAAGNIWFLAAAEIFPRPTNNSIGAFNDFDSVIVRAVYDPATFSYELELVAEVGQVVRGKNSDTPYQIRFLSIADNDSISSGSAFSHNLMREPVPGIDVADLATRDPRTLGGFVVAAEIVYDVNRDGRFIKVTGSSGDPASLDQEYNALLFIGPRNGASQGF